MKIPHGISSLFSLTCRCRISSLESHSHSFRHSAGQGGSGGRKLHLSASAPPLNWQSSSLECSCNASHHHSTCPDQLQCKRSFISEVRVGHSSGLCCCPGRQWQSDGVLVEKYVNYRSDFWTDKHKPTDFKSLQVAIQAVILLPLTAIAEITPTIKVKGRFAVEYWPESWRLVILFVLSLIAGSLGKRFHLCYSLPSSVYTWLT